jgi:DNA processing protein
VSSGASQGVHLLIRNRNALLVTGAADVLEVVQPVGGRHHPGQGLTSAPTPRDELGSVEREILDAVPVSRGSTADRIARVAGLAPETVAHALAKLHRDGFVERSADRWRLAPKERPVAPAEREGGEFVP